MRLAVLGSGMIVAEFLPYAADVSGLELVAICGRASSRWRLEDMQRQFNIRRVHTDLDECLRDPDVDTVWVAVPNSLHFTYAQAALAAGKHVICEKPFVLREDELAELRAMAAERDLILVEAITTQYLANYRWIRENLSRVGDVRVIQCDYSQYSSRYDAFREGAVAPAFDPAQGGGAPAAGSSPRGRPTPWPASRRRSEGRMPRRSTCRCTRTAWSRSSERSRR